MKSLKLLLSVLALVAFAAAPVLRAEDAPAPGSAEHKKGPHGDRLAELTAKLGLSEDQVAKLKPILQDEMQAMKALKEDTSLEKDAKRAKMMEIRKSHMEQINAILTPEQQAKLKAGREQRKEGDKPKKADKPKS